MASKAFELAKEIVAAELLAEHFPKPTPAKPVVKPKTEIYKWKDKLVKDRKVLADVTGQGKLVKLRIASPSSDFKVLLQIDGETFINDSYTDLTEMLAAYEEDDVYYLHLEDKAFRKRLLVVVEVDEAVTFTLLFAEVLVEN